MWPLLLPLLASVTGVSSARSSIDSLPRFTIAPGVEMPAVNLGHPDDEGGSETASAALWLSLGGRGIDTAYNYHNQDEVATAVGTAISKGMNRSSIFITTKISPSLCTKASALAAVKEDLKELKLPQVDLVLHHFPCRSATENKAVWSGLLEAKKMGLARAVGVSNYVSKDLKALLEDGGEAPAVNQCSMSVGNHDDSTISFCNAHSITYESYSPLRRVDLGDRRLSSIASVHNVSTAQVALRWIVQQGCPVATSPGVNQEYSLEDLNLGSFKLSSAEMAALSAI